MALQGVLIDSSVLLDIVTADPQWCPWSSEALAMWAEQVPLYINVVIYTEVSMGFARIEEVEAALPPDAFRRVPVPWEAGFLAGKAFVAYRQRGGTRTQPLPDFLVVSLNSRDGFALFSVRIVSSITTSHSSRRLA